MKRADLILILLTLAFLGCGVNLPTRLLKPQSRRILAVVDVSDPIDPRISQEIEIESRPKYIRFCDGSAIVTTDKGVLIFNVDDEGRLERAGEIPMKGISCGAVMRDDLLFTPVGSEIAITDLKGMTERTRIKVGKSGIIDMDLYGKYLCLLDHSTFHLLAIEDPTNPRLLASFPISFRNPQVTIVSPEMKSGDPEAMKALMESDRLLPADYMYPILSLIRSRIFRPIPPSKERIAISGRYLVRWGDGLRVWIGSAETGEGDYMDLEVEYTRYLYLSGKRRLPSGRSMDEVTRAYEHKGKLVFIVQDKWGEAVDIERGVLRAVSDLAISGDMAYLLVRPKKLIVLDLPGMGILSSIDLGREFERIAPAEERIVLF